MKTSLHRAATPQPRSRPRVNNRPHPKTPSSGQHPRRRFLRLAAGAAALPAVSRIARAQSFPTRPITMIVPAAAGGPGDAIARLLADRMRRSLGQTIIIENVSGAAGSIGTGRVARARPDGYTIDLGLISTHVLNGAFYPLPYDVLNDFAPIAPVATAPFVLYARKMLPAKDLNELIAWLKGNPNKASAGFGASSANLVTAFFQKQTGTTFTLVPYRGVAPATQDLVAGQIDLLFGTPDALSLMRAGSIKAASDPTVASPAAPAAYRRDADGRRDNPKAAARGTLDTTDHDSTAVICWPREPPCRHPGPRPVSPAVPFSRDYSAATDDGRRRR